MDLLVLRFEGPLMAFGGPTVSARRPTMPAPGRSMVTGLIASALGWDYRDYDLHHALQSSLDYAVRRDREGSRLTDFQTADLSQPWMAESGWWTTNGQVPSRSGNAKAVDCPVLRYVTYWQDSAFTLALGLLSRSPVGLDEVATALVQPARPLVFGRKNCLPTSAIYRGRVAAERPVDSLVSIEVPDHAVPDGEGRFAAWWTGRRPPEAEGVREAIWQDWRDFRTRAHVGSRVVQHGLLRIATPA